MEKVVTEFTLPDLLADWPYPPEMNPHYDALAPECDSWLFSFKVFPPEMEKAVSKVDCARITLRGIPKLDKDAARAACYLMNLFIATDECMDAEDGAGAQEKAMIIKDALLNPYNPRPKGETSVATTESSTPTTQRRLVREFAAFVDAVATQAELRDDSTILSFEDFMKLRRLTVGARPVFTNIEMRMNIPDEVSDHPIVELLRSCATDMIIITNDLVSHNVEQARGDDLHNSITIIMHQEGLDIQGSIDFLAKYHGRVAETFLTTQVDLPSFGPAIDVDLRQYVDGMATWVEGNYWWQFESHRYFGSKGLEIMKSGKVQLSPKEPPPPGIYMNMPA